MKKYIYVSMAIASLMIFGSCDENTQKGKLAEDDVDYFYVVEEVETEYTQPEVTIEQLQSQSQPQPKYKTCPVCAGSCRCGGCGGTGTIYSVFYEDGEVGPARFTNCGACGGNGLCGACDGSGLTIDYGF